METAARLQPSASRSFEARFRAGSGTKSDSSCGMPHGVAPLPSPVKGQALMHRTGAPRSVLRSKPVKTHHTQRRLTRGRTPPGVSTSKMSLGRISADPMCCSCSTRPVSTNDTVDSQQAGTGAHRPKAGCLRPQAKQAGPLGEYLAKAIAQLKRKFRTACRIASLRMILARWQTSSDRSAARS